MFRLAIANSQADHETAMPIRHCYEAVCGSERLQDGCPVPGEEVYDELVHVFVAARNLFPENFLDLVFLSSVGSPNKRIENES
jgi:hypothetical protein